MRHRLRAASLTLISGAIACLGACSGPALSPVDAGAEQTGGPSSSSDAAPEGAPSSPEGPSSSDIAACTGPLTDSPCKATLDDEIAAWHAQVVGPYVCFGTDCCAPAGPCGAYSIWNPPASANQPTCVYDATGTTLVAARLVSDSPIQACGNGAHTMEFGPSFGSLALCNLADVTERCTFTSPLTTPPCDAPVVTPATSCAATFAQQQALAATLCVAFSQVTVARCAGLDVWERTNSDGTSTQCLYPGDGSLVSDTETMFMCEHPYNCPLSCTHTGTIVDQVFDCALTVTPGIGPDCTTPP